MIPALADLRLFGFGSWLNIQGGNHAISLLPEFFGIDIASGVRSAGVSQPFLRRLDSAGLPVDQVGDRSAHYVHGRPLDFALPPRHQEVDSRAKKGQSVSTFGQSSDKADSGVLIFQQLTAALRTISSMLQSEAWRIEQALAGNLYSHDSPELLVWVLVAKNTQDRSQAKSLVKQNVRKYWIDPNTETQEDLCCKAGACRIGPHMGQGISGLGQHVSSRSLRYLDFTNGHPTAIGLEPDESWTEHFRHLCHLLCGLMTIDLYA